MIAFLHSPLGKWIVRALALVIGWLFVAQVLEITWPAGGDAFLIALLIIMVACSAAFVVFMLDAIILPMQQSSGVKSSAKPRFSGPIPTLSKAKQAQVRRLVKAMEKAGVFAPETPDPALAFPGFAIDKQPIDWINVLMNLAEAGFYFPDSDLVRWSENLWFGELPETWRNSPSGRILAFLWEDGNVVFSFVKTEELPALAASGAGGEEWSAADEGTITEFFTLTNAVLN